MRVALDLDIRRAESPLSPNEASAPVEYTLEVTNNSTSELASPVVVDIALDIGRGLSVVQTPAGWACNPLGSSILRCVHDDPLPPSSTGVVTVTAAQPLEGGVLTVDGDSHVRDILIAAVALSALALAIISPRRVAALIRRNA